MALKTYKMSEVDYIKPTQGFSVKEDPKYKRN